MKVSNSSILPGVAWTMTDMLVAAVSDRVIETAHLPMLSTSAVASPMTSSLQPLASALRRVSADPSVIMKVILDSGGLVSNTPKLHSFLNVGRGWVWGMDR
jgi:hypothetical protein